MRQLVSGVTLITARWNGQPYGLTATAIASLSDRPPSVLVCVNRVSSGHDPIRAAGCFGVNILTARQRPLAERFASGVDGPERFEMGVWGTLETGAPILADCAVQIDCELANEWNTATHTVFVGNIVTVEVKECDELLVYAGGGYHALRAL